MATYDQFKRSLITQESNHDYSAVNKRTGALGFGQVMPQNLTGWGKNAGRKNFGWDYDALGRDVTPQEFLTNPALQEKIVDHQLKQAFNKYGPEGAARWWYSNSPFASNKKPAANEPSPNQYAAQVTGRMGYSGGGGGGGKMTQGRDLSALLYGEQAAPQPTKAAGRDLSALLYGDSKPEQQKPTIKEQVKADVAPWARVADAAATTVGKVIGTGSDILAKGVNAVAGRQVMSDQTAAYYDQQYKKREEAYQKDRAARGDKGVDLPRLGAEITLTAPVAALSKGYQGAKFLTRAGAEATARLAASGAGIAGLTSAGDAESMAYGAAGGAIGGVIGEKVITPVVKKGINIAQGRLNPNAQVIDDLGKKYGVRTSVGDAGKNPHIRKSEALLDQIPVIGTSGFRGAQQTEVKAAAEKVADSARRRMELTGYKGIDKIEKAAASGDRNAARIVGIINNAGNDSSKVLQAGAEVRLWRESNIAKQLYDEAGQFAKQQGGTITPANTQNALQTKLDELKSSLAPDEPLMNELSKISTRLQDPNIVKNYANMRLLRSQLGEMADTLAAGQSPNMAASKAIGDLRSAVEKDISDYALNSGNASLKKAYLRADNFFKGAVKNRDENIAKALKQQNPDEIYSQFIKFDKADRAATFYRSLDPKAQAALRYEMTTQAMNKATSGANGTLDTFSPAKFAQEFERMRAPYSSIFKGQDKAEMDGFVKLMRHVERAGQYAENPANGSRMLLPTAAFAGGAAAMQNPAGAALGASSIYAYSKLLTTAAGKRIMLAANDLPPNSPKLDNLLKMAQKMTVTTGANQGKD